MLAYLIASVLTLIGYWKLFTYFGEKGWKCLIPVYNAILLLRFLGWPATYIFFFLIPVGNLIFYFFVCKRIALKLGHDSILSALGLFMFPFIFFPMYTFNVTK